MHTVCLSPASVLQFWQQIKHLTALFSEPVFNARSVELSTQLCSTLPDILSESGKENVRWNLSCLENPFEMCALPFILMCLYHTGLSSVAGTRTAPVGQFQINKWITELFLSRQNQMNKRQWRKSVETSSLTVNALQHSCLLHMTL